MAVPAPAVLDGDIALHSVLHGSPASGRHAPIRLAKDDPTGRDLKYPKPRQSPVPPALPDGAAIELRPLNPALPAPVRRVPRRARGPARACVSGPLDLLLPQPPPAANPIRSAISIATSLANAA